MKLAARNMLVVVLALAVTAPLSSAEKQKARKKADPGAQILKRLEKAELDEDQVAKIKEMAAAFAPKLAEAQEKLGLTKEQRKARRQAARQNKADGVKGKKARKAVNAAMNLTDDQKSAMADIRKLQSEFNTSVFALLSDEQRTKADIKMKPKKKKRKKNRSE